MMIFTSFQQMISSAVSIIGITFFSLILFLAPMPSFYRVYNKRSTEEIPSSIPYCLTLLSCQILIYYGFMKLTDGFMIIAINFIGFALHAAYITIYLIYAPKPSKIETTMLVIIINLGLGGTFILATHLALQGYLRVAVVGWMTIIISQLTELADPLCVMMHVIMTKKVDDIPIGISFCQVVCDLMWFFYGLLINDYYIAVQNGLGFAVGITQMILFIIYHIVVRVGLGFIDRILQMIHYVIYRKPLDHILHAQPHPPNGDLKLAVWNTTISPVHENESVNVDATGVVVN